MSSMSNPDNDVMRKQQATDLRHPTDVTPDKAEQELEKRVERLEKRLEEGAFGTDGLVRNPGNHGLDDSETADALRRAVDRANDKRGGSA